MRSAERKAKLALPLLVLILILLHALCNADCLPPSIKPLTA